ncbi:hypothetical protein TNIN_83041 [Trichonephila inaurata madagascariensis]|uniref:Uncharacterized protein n=1 Tax=Trichonephila inaurata madagascariensis TaxID=2747483 RepID=A0A8X6XRZ4_9ARAC|nr:hypothetical protein TNIN_83041 [Trichonephila inaurata madagascariensis]
MSQGKETSLELRNLIVKLKGENKSYSEIAKIVKKPRSTVQTIYRNYVMRRNALNKSRCGRPHKLCDRDARAIAVQWKRVSERNRYYREPKKAIFFCPVKGFDFLEKQLYSPMRQIQRFWESDGRKKVGEKTHNKPPEFDSSGVSAEECNGLGRNGGNWVGNLGLPMET